MIHLSGHGPGVYLLTSTFSIRSQVPCYRNEARDDLQEKKKHRVEEKHQRVQSDEKSSGAPLFQSISGTCYAP